MICKVYFYIFLIFSLLMFIFGVNFLIWDYSLIFEYNLLYVNSSYLSATILLDWMSLIFVSFVMFISSMVILYSNEYMHGDLSLVRFILLVVLFVVSMVFLILSPNLIFILLGWDGLGLVSYCLVIYYQNVKSYNAGMLTALSNRIGDVAILMSIAWMMNYGSWNFIFYIDLMKGDYEMKLICILVVLAALTKSAQIPFSSWLPAAMAAPTPVSSLVHSSTLVTAGVYLIIRFSSCLGSSMSYFLLFLSSMTMFMAGIGANFEFDLKKIIALSTLSQLGLMMSILCLGSYDLALFHLLTHALFKALLFMCSGSIIHNFSSMQDIRYMGGLINHMPMAVAFFSICNFSLCGLPFFSGFYSKDLIVETLSMSYLNLYIYVVYYFSVGLTVCYSFRLMFFMTSGDYNFVSLSGLEEVDFYMVKGMKGLILLVIFMGSLMSWLIFLKPIFICLPVLLKLMALMMILIGFLVGSYLFDLAMNYGLNKRYILGLKEFFSQMWYMPYISTSGMSKPATVSGGLYYKLIDQGWLEFYGNTGISNFLKKLVFFFQELSMNHLKIYFMLMFIWFLFLALNF